MFQSMLASDITDLRRLRFPLLMSTKLDGVRASVQQGTVISRNIKAIPNQHVQEIFALPELENLDGELIMGDPIEENCFRKTTSAIMTGAGEPDVKFYIFDYFAPHVPFCERLDMARAAVEKSKNPSLIVVPHFEVATQEDMEAMETKWLDEGHEGAMLRHKYGPYKQGRSTENEGWLLKLKRFKHGEAVITGFQEQLHNANPAQRDATGYLSRASFKAGMIPKGTLGALLVRDVATGIAFQIGTGFDDGLRLKIWMNREAYLGQVVRYKYFPKGCKDKPRFPIFDGFRPEGA